MQKILNKKLIQKYIKWIVPHDEVGLFQEHKVGLTFVIQTK